MCELVLHVRMATFFCETEKSLNVYIFLKSPPTPQRRYGLSFSLLFSVETLPRELNAEWGKFAEKGLLYCIGEGKLMVEG